MKPFPSKRILVLSDGVTGHTRQSEAVVSELRGVYRSRGIPEGDVVVDFLELNVKFHPGFLGRLLFFLSHPLHRSCKGCGRCLRQALDGADVRRLEQSRADAVVSPFGKKTVDANLWVAGRCGARSIVVMTPRSRLGEFDLAILPRHDGVRSPNAVITEGAPNAIAEPLLVLEASRMRSQIGELADFRIGLLLGGDYKNFRMREETVRGLVDQIRAASDALGADVLATTSRRTPRRVEEELKRGLSGRPRCRLLVIANEENPAGTVAGILGLCQAVVVSPESVSMISEAASSGAHVIVYKDGDFLHPKHRLFLENLERNGHIELLDTERVAAAVERCAQNGRRTRKLEDRATIRRALEGIV